MGTSAEHAVFKQSPVQREFPGIFAPGKLIDTVSLNFINGRLIKSPNQTNYRGLYNACSSNSAVFPRARGPPQCKRARFEIELFWLEGNGIDVQVSASTFIDRPSFTSLFYTIHVCCRPRQRLLLIPLCVSIPMRIYIPRII